MRRMAAPAPRILFIDNSNSFTKFALGSAERIGTVRKLATRTLTASGIRAALKGWRFERVILCSVVPVMGDLLEKTLAPIPVLRVSSKLRLGIGIDYPKPARIGADRLANAAAAAAMHGAPAIVVDFGTAVSFEPGQSRSVTLVPLRGDRIVYGFRQAVMGPLGGKDA